MGAEALFGDVSCLVAALCWAVAVTLFRKPIELYGAQAVNLAKNTVGAALLSVSALAVGQLQRIDHRAPRLPGRLVSRAAELGASQQLD